MPVTQASLKKLQLYNSNYRTFGKGKITDNKTISGCPGLWGEGRGMNRWSTGNF